MKKLKLFYLTMLIGASIGMMACSGDDMLEQSSWYGEQTVQTKNNDTGEWEEQLSSIMVEFTHGDTQCRVMRSLKGLYSTSASTYPVAWKIKGKSFVLYDNSIMDDNTIWEGKIESNSMTLMHHQSQTTYNLTKR